MRRTKTKKTMANVLALTMVASSLNISPMAVVAETEDDAAATYNGAKVPSIAGVLDDHAIILGDKAEIVTDDEKGKVLKLSGNSKGDGVLRLPSNLYENVTDGFTISMDVCVDSAASNYTRLFQSSCCNMGTCDFPWNSPGISIDLGENNFWRSEIFIGNDGNDNSEAEVSIRGSATTAVDRSNWHNITMSMDASTATITCDNSIIYTTTGDFSKLFGTSDYLSSYVNNYLGDSIYQDASVKAKFDNVKIYNSTSIFDASTLQLSYDFENVEKVVAETTMGNATTYTDGTELTSVKEITSPDGTVKVSVLKDDNGRFFYSAYNNGEAVIYASQLGIVTNLVDFTTDAAISAESIAAVTDDYTLYNGKHTGAVSDTCTEYTFTLTKNSKNLDVIIRVYDDGMAYRYGMSENADISGEASEFVFPDAASLWTYAQPNVTYEGTYTELSMSNVYNAAAMYTTPTLAKVNDNYLLLTEGAVFSEENAYCSSYFKTTKNSKNLKWTFGNMQSGNVSMKGSFETPWRIAVIGDDLNEIVNSDIITSVNPDADDIDWSWVKTGKVAWSWWSSTGDDPIVYEGQKDYIDFAAENGWEYVCLDYGWILWDDYKDKVKELADYAAKKNVGIWLWYGVNDVGHTAAGAYPDHSLLNEENITEEFQWANSIGIQGVKVDYYERDDQSTMNQMYLCADIAANNQLMVLFHGCTNPAGENRTFPNVVSYEAVYGAEYYKWRTEPSTANIITYLFTRNAVGSADFTPTALPVGNISATYGFMLGTSVYIESGVVHFAENVNVYEGYKGLSFMNDVPTTWDETVVSEGSLSEYGSVARRSGDDWYVASLTTTARTTDISLDFLAAGKTYTAYIYKTNEANTDLEIVTETVTNTDNLAIALKSNDGFAAKITTETFTATTSYEENYNYYEAENATKNGSAVTAANQYASGMKVVGYIGAGTDNTVSYNVNVATDGVYEVKVFYVSGTNRRFYITANDQEALRTAPMNSGDWVSVRQESIYLKLKSGDNKITFANDLVDAPNLDRIAVSKTATDKEASVSDTTEDVTENNDAENYTYTMYEAENATIVGATKNANTVGWLGNSEDSYVLFEDVSVEKSGEYYLLVQYYSGEDRSVYVSVNGAAGFELECPSSGAWSDYATKIYIPVTLNAGVNTIKIYNPNAYCPDLDSIGVSTTVIGDITNVDKENQEATIVTSTDTKASVDKESAESVKTGDNSPIVLFTITIIVSGVVVLCTYRKKKYQN